MSTGCHKIVHCIKDDNRNYGTPCTMYYYGLFGKRNGECSPRNVRKAKKSPDGEYIALYLEEDLSTSWVRTIRGGVSSGGGSMGLVCLKSPDFRRNRC